MSGTNEKRIFHFIGKRERHKVTIEIEVCLKEKGNCAPYLDIDLQPCRHVIEFTSGVGIKGRSCGEGWGCLDGEQLAQMVPSKAGALRKLAAFSKRWHLNGLQAGTRRQREVLQLPENAVRLKATCTDHYATACDILKEHGLYKCGSYYKYPDGRKCPSCKGEGTVGSDPYAMPCVACKRTGWEDPFPQPYRYGTAWLTEQMPDEAIADLRVILAELEDHDG